MLMGSAIGAADKMKDENALQHWRGGGARAAKIEVRGDAKDLVLISSRLVATGPTFTDWPKTIPIP